MKKTIVHRVVTIKKTIVDGNTTKIEETTTIESDDDLERALKNLKDLSNVKDPWNFWPFQ